MDDEVDITYLHGEATFATSWFRRTLDGVFVHAPPERNLNHNKDPIKLFPHHIHIVMSIPQDITFLPQSGKKRGHSDVFSQLDSTGSASKYASFAPM